MKLQMHDLSYFLVKSFFGDDCLSTNIYYVRIKKDKVLIVLLVGNQRGLYTSKLKPLYTAFLHSIKLSGYRMEM